MNIFFFQEVSKTLEFFSFFLRGEGAEWEAGRLHFAVIICTNSAETKDKKDMAFRALTPAFPS